MDRAVAGYDNGYRPKVNKAVLIGLANGYEGPSVLMTM